MQTRGHELIDRLLSNVTNFKSAVQSNFKDSIFLDETHFPIGRFDPVKIILRANVLGLSGVDVEQQLQKSNIRVEMADQDTVVFLATLADDSDDFKYLESALVPILKVLQGPIRETQISLSWSIEPIAGISTRDAYFADSEFVSAVDAVGRISADLIAPYPPGVAVLAPGEIITKQIVNGLAATKKAGVRIAYASDSTLATYRVIK
ncbi:unannotated protein [freshwater metagenome]|uniref:Unannotated protein n=1 Tax=freshwater metagenome TaxID=449393 RepID=A0A6J6Q6C7_9ZZZZ